MPSNEDHDDHDDDHDDDDELQPKIWTFSVFVAAFALAYAGRYKVAGVFFTIGALYIWLQSQAPLSESEQVKRQYMEWSPQECLENLQETLQGNDKTMNGKNESRDMHISALAAFSAMANKLQKLELQQKRQNGGRATTEADMSLQKDLEDVYTACRKAVYICLTGSLQADDQVVSASFALLSLVLKSGGMLQQTDDKSLCVLVQSADTALERAKAFDSRNTTISQQNRMLLQQQLHSADLQCKACYLLGSLAAEDGGKLLMADRIVIHGGLSVILNALAHFPFHMHLRRWGLWALQNLCSENDINKAVIVNSHEHCVAVVLECMRNNAGKSTSIEVARSGLVILYDLLRESEDVDVTNLRKTALASGLHEIVVQAATEYDSAADIVMMGRQLLVGTGYKGTAIAT